MSIDEYQQWWKLFEDSQKNAPAARDHVEKEDRTTTAPPITTSMATPIKVPIKIEVGYENDSVKITAETAASISVASGLGCTILCVLFFTAFYKLVSIFLFNLLKLLGKQEGG